MTDPWMGRTFEGCRLDARIAASSSAHLYRATLLGPSKPVAVAIIHPAPHRPLPSPAQVLASTWHLRTNPHPGIATIQHAATVEGQLVVVMDDLRGESLQQAIRRGPLSTGAVVQLAYELGTAAAHLHGLGLVHGLISPNRVLLTPNGACLLEAGVADGVAKKSPTVDIVAIGFCLHLAATGARRTTRAGAIGAQAPMLPPWLAELIDDCCNGDPDRRPADGPALLARVEAHRAQLPDLRASHRGLPVSVGTPTPTPEPSATEQTDALDPHETRVSISPPPVPLPPSPRDTPADQREPPQPETPTEAPSEPIPPVAAGDTSPPVGAAGDLSLPAVASEPAPGPPADAVPEPAATPPSRGAMRTLLLLAAIGLVTVLAVGGIFVGAWWVNRPDAGGAGPEVAVEAPANPEPAAAPPEAPVPPPDPNPFAAPERFALRVHNTSGRALHLSCTWAPEPGGTDTAGGQPGIEEAMLQGEGVNAESVPLFAACDAQDPTSGESLWSWTADAPPEDGTRWSLTVPPLAPAPTPSPRRRNAARPTASAPAAPAPSYEPAPAAPELEPAATLRVVSASKRKRKQKGIQVRIDGRKRGEVPVTVPELPLGAYRIEASREDRRVACVVTLDEEGLTVAVDPDSGTCSRL